MRRCNLRFWDFIKIDFGELFVSLVQLMFLSYDVMQVNMMRDVVCEMMIMFVKEI